MLWRNRRFVAALSFFVLIPIGLGVRFIPIPNFPWVNDLLGSVCYEIAWCLLAFTVWPKRQAVWQIPLWVLGLTCMIEILQLWHPPWLEAIRATLPGRLVLGNTFVWLDFTHYLVGSGAGWLWLRSIWRWGARSQV